MQNVLSTDRNVGVARVGETARRLPAWLQERLSLGLWGMGERRMMRALLRLSDALKEGPRRSREPLPGLESETSTCSQSDRQPTRVCFISPLGEGLYRPQSGRPFGGAEVQFYLAASALARDPAYAVTVLVTVEQESSIEQWRGLTLVRRVGKAGGCARRSAIGEVCAAFASFLRMFVQLRQIDAEIFLHAGSGIEVGAYALICLVLRRKFLFVVASTADLSHPVTGVRGPLKWLYPLGVRLAHAVICRTQDQREALQRQYGREGVVIRTAYPIPPAYEGPRRAILWVGRIHPVKQPQLFLDLAEQLPEVPCVLIGMRDAMYPELWNAVRHRAGERPNVTFHANLPLDQTDDWFRSAAVLVNTSTYEGFPNTFVQAAIHGVPIVSWTVNPDQVLSRHGIGYCAVGSFSDLVTSVRRLGADKEVFTDCRRRAREYGVAHHDLDRSMTALRQLLHTLKGAPSVCDVRTATP